MMKNLRTSLLVVLSLLLPVLTQAQEQSLLWKVSGKDLSSPSYVYGTMHMLCAQDFQMPEKLQSALAESQTLVLELNPMDPAVMAEMQPLMMNPGMENVYKGLAAEDYALIDSTLKVHFGAGLDQVGIMKPMVLSSMLTMAVMLPCEAKISVDGILAQQATESEKPIQSLETATYQMSIFDEIPNALQIDEMLRSLGEEGFEEFEALKKAYFAEDLQALAKLMNDNEMVNQYEETFLLQRNRNWAEALPALMQEGSCLVAVGAGHLSGAEGLLQLLKKAGYTLEPVL